MATELAKAYVQIIPSAEGIKGKITKELGGEASSAGESFGKNMVKKISGVLAAAGIGKMISNAINEGADLQQSIGGIDTLFKDSADKVKQYASEAYRTAGMSANEYMQSVTSFSASLLQGLGGDTEKAAEVANMALIDMSDNANKMGTSMELIQNAYQGFAKQNYTMLDNLKLGYGGTKTEMQRLLKDAEAITGVKYDMSNLSDVYTAINVIQKELDITGTTAKEASSTFSGSLASMAAAGKNLLAKLTLGESIDTELKELTSSVGIFVGNNLLPMVGNLFKGVPAVLNSAFDMAIKGLNFVSQNADNLVQDGIELISQLVVGVISALPSIGEAAFNVVKAFGTSILNTDWSDVIGSMINSIRDNISETSVTILSVDTSLIDSVLESISVKLPDLLSKGADIVTNVVNGILQGLPNVITSAGEMVNVFIGYILQNGPTILDTGVQMILGLVSGIVTNLPAIADSAIQVIAQLVTTIFTNLPQILESGIQIIAELAAGIIRAIPNVVAVIPQVFQGIKNAFGNLDWKSIGTNIIEGIKNGIVNGLSLIIEAAKEVAQKALDAAKEALDIHSPSRKFFQIGEFATIGLAQGILNRAKAVTDAMKEVANDTILGYNATLAVGMPTQSAGIVNSDSGMYARMDMLLSLLSRYLPECAKPVNIDGDSLLNSINRQLGMAVIG